MDTISKKTALFIGVGLLAVIIGVVAVVWYMAPAVSPETAKVTETVGQPAPIQQEQDPMAELQKLLDAGKAKPLWKQYLETYWPAAAGVGIFIGLVVVVMTLLKRRRLPDDDEEVILTMDGEDVPSPPEDEIPPEEKIAAEAMKQKIKNPWPLAKVAFGLVIIFIAYTALHSFFIAIDLEKSVAEVKKELASKVGRGSFDSLGTTVANLKSATDELTTKVGDARERLTTAEDKLGVVESTADEAKRSAGEAKNIASAVRTDIHDRTGLKWRMENLEKRQTKDYNELSGAISSVKTDLTKDLRTFTAKQDSINAFLASKFSISQSEMDSLAAWFPKKQNVPN